MEPRVMPDIWRKLVEFVNTLPFEKGQEKEGKGEKRHTL
jgi:hypothetical protein